MIHRETYRELLVFVFLVALGVVGRSLDHAWNFTPLTAITALGAFTFRSWAPAVLLPVTVLAASDLFLPAHDNWPVLVAVYAMALVPLALGRAARGAAGWRRAACWGLCGFVPATAFFLVTNFAVWASKSLYAASFSGLMDCYAKALPFYRAMLAGDLCYIALVAGGLAMASALQIAPADRREA